MLGVEGRHVAIDLLEPDLVGVEHGAAPVAREAVAVQVGDVDIARAQRDALFENAGAFIDEGPEAALEDLLVADLPSRDATLLGRCRDQCLDFGIGPGSPRAGLVAVPPASRLLAEAPLLAEPVADM